MYSILTLNKIAACGTDKFGGNYTCSSDVKDPTAIMVRSASMHEMELSDATIAIARAGAGTNNIPVEACAEKGVVVFNTPGANANAVKELVICGLLMASRKVGAAIDWCKTLKGEGEAVGKLVEKGKSNFAGPEIGGKTLGIVGLGAIGFKVAVAASALGMKIVGYDPFLSDAVRAQLPEGTKVVTDINDIFKESDYITLHLPLNDATKNTVNKETLALCKDGVRILNFARGGLVNSDAVIEALDEGKMACYVTDFPDAKLIGVDGVIAIPHLGASTPESEENCAAMGAQELIDYLKDGNIKNSVNMPAVFMARGGVARVTVIHKNQPNMIATITDTISKDGVNIASFEDKSRGEIAYSIIDCDSEVSDAVAKDIENLDGVIRVRVIK